MNFQNSRMSNPENNLKENRENEREGRPHPKEANPEVSVGRVHTATAKLGTLLEFCMWTNIETSVACLQDDRQSLSSSRSLNHEHKKAERSREEGRLRQNGWLPQDPRNNTVVRSRTSLLTQLSQHWHEEVPRGLDETGPQKSLLSLYEG